MGFIDAEKPSVHRQVIRKIQVGGTDAALQGTAQRSGRPPAPKGNSDSAFEKKKRAESLSLPPRNSRSQLAVNWSSVKLPGLLTMNCPVGTHGARNRRNQKSAGRIAELVALEQQEFMDYRIDAGHAECRLQRGIQGGSRRGPTAAPEAWC